VKRPFLINSAAGKQSNASNANSSEMMSEKKPEMLGNMASNENGPQLTFDKSYLCMISPKGCIKDDCGK
jgi:hypothetical protein